MEKHKEFSERNHNGRQEKVSTQSNVFLDKKSALFIVVVLPFLRGYLAPNRVKSLKRKKYNSFAFEASTISFWQNSVSCCFQVRFFHHSLTECGEWDWVWEKESPIENRAQGYWCPNRKGQRVQKSVQQAFLFFHFCNDACSLIKFCYNKCYQRRQWY